MIINIIVVFHHLHIIFRWEAIRVQAVPPAIQGLLGHDQAPAHPQWRLALPMHHLPGVLPQPVSHAEAHEGPQAWRYPLRLAHREDIPVPLLRLRRVWGETNEAGGSRELERLEECNRAGWKSWILRNVNEKMLEKKRGVFLGGWGVVVLLLFFYMQRPRWGAGYRGRDGGARKTWTWRDVLHYCSDSPGRSLHLQLCCFRSFHAAPQSK